MRILLTNDDGIHAEGLRVLEEAMRPFSDDIGIAAPGEEQSGASHSISISAPLRIQRLAPHRLVVHGRPADCVLVGVNALWDDGKWPDVILSGINHGGNIGGDVSVSGTVGAAEQGAQMGIRSIALSQCYPWDQALDLNAAHQATLRVAQALLAQPWPQNGLFSVNFPHRLARHAELVMTCSAATASVAPAQEVMRSPFGRDFAWLKPGRETLKDSQGRGSIEFNGIPTDLETVAKGCIAATPIQICRDHREFLLNLKQKPIKL